MGRCYIDSPQKYYFEDLGIRNACLGFRQMEQNHLMENLIYNELRNRGFTVDVGNIRQQGRSGQARQTLKVDSVANQGIAATASSQPTRFPMMKNASRNCVRC